VGVAFERQYTAAGLSSIKLPSEGGVGAGAGGGVSGGGHPQYRGPRGLPLCAPHPFRVCHGGCADCGAAGEGGELRVYRVKEAEAEVAAKTMEAKWKAEVAAAAAGNGGDEAGQGGSGGAAQGGCSCEGD